MKLLPCPSCERHVRSDETACPFCNQAVAFCANGRCAETGDRALSRAAVLFLGATALAACGKRDGGGGATITIYGPPPIETDAAVPMIEPSAVMDAGVTPVSSGKKP
jgi:hypothetical protein